MFQYSTLSHPPPFSLLDGVHAAIEAILAAEEYYTVADLTKRFIREIPFGVVPKEHYEDFRSILESGKRPPCGAMMCLFRVGLNVTNSNLAISY